MYLWCICAPYLLACFYYSNNNGTAQVDIQCCPCLPLICKRINMWHFLGTSCCCMDRKKRIFERGAPGWVRKGVDATPHTGSHTIVPSTKGPWGSCRKIFDDFILQSRNCQGLNQEFNCISWSSYPSLLLSKVSVLGPNSPWSMATMAISKNLNLNPGVLMVCRSCFGS